MAFKIQPKKTMITSVFTDTLHLKWQIFCCKNKLCWHPREVNKKLASENVTYKTHRILHESLCRWQLKKFTVRNNCLQQGKKSKIDHLQVFFHLI